MNIRKFLNPKVVIRKVTEKRKFRSSKEYWENRYSSNGNSGDGSYDKMAEFKASTINSFVEKHNIQTVIEFGCGDGNQLSLAGYKSYIGMDVSPTAINICKEKFVNDLNKSFYLYDSLAFVDNKGLFKAELSMSLDVIYHLIEDDIFEKYMQHLFDASEKYVIIFSNNHPYYVNYHVKSRKFTDWIDENAKSWQLIDTIKNTVADWADFFIYQKQ